MGFKLMVTVGEKLAVSEYSRPRGLCYSSASAARRQLKSTRKELEHLHADEL